jgi:hypothetical protein
MSHILSNFTRHLQKRFLPALLLLFAAASAPGNAYALASNNIPLDSPVYLYIEKLAGFGLLESDVKGLRPYSRAEAARLLLEAEGNLERLDSDEQEAVRPYLTRLRELVPREASLRKEESSTPIFDINPVSYARLRYVYLDGIPRNYTRDVYDPGNQSVFGFIGGNLRPGTQGILHKSGTEGTPLLENNEGIIYRDGHNAEFRWATEVYVSDKISFLVEPLFLTTPYKDGRSERVLLEKGYAKLGGGGLELEVGRDANWFGPGYRGALTLTNNARNFDIIKLSSPEPVDVGWIRKYLGDFKYAFIGSRFDETGSGPNLRHPWFIGAKLSLKPKPWFEIGVNFVRQEGGPGFSGSTTARDAIFGGGETNHSNTIAGIDMRFRIPWLRNTEVFGEYVGEDSAAFWPFVESYVAGFFIPRLTSSGQDDLRFEYFWGHQDLYSDGKFPAGYTYKGMSPGHSQGGGTQEFFVRYSHWFSVRNNLALEYFHTDRGRQGRVAGQLTEEKNAWRAFWNLPVYGDFNMNLMYGWEKVNNLNLVGGVQRTNQIVEVDLNYRY